MAGPIPIKLQEIAATTNTSTDADASSHPSVVQMFKDRVRKFWQVYQDLENRADEVPNALKDQYSSLMSQGSYIRSTIETITNTYDEVSTWLSDVWGYFGAAGIDARLGNLGFAVTVPLAIVVGASALIVKWLSDAYAMQKKLDTVQRLQNQGYNADQAASIVKNATTGSSLISFSGLKQPLIIGVLAVAGLWYANKRGWI